MIRFPKDDVLRQSFRNQFIDARWNAITRSWSVRGKTAMQRAELWAAEQEPRLRALEQLARDAEWLAPDAAAGEELRLSAPEPTTPDVQRPGSKEPAWIRPPTRWCQPRALPDETLKTALAGVTAWSRELSRASFFGLWPTPVYAWYWQQTLRMTFNRPLGRYRTPFCIDWQWSEIFGGLGWAEFGFVPDDNIHGLPGLERRAWQAVNPGKPCLWLRS